MRKCITLTLALFFSAIFLFSFSITASASQASAQKMYKKASDRLARLSKDRKKRRYRYYWEQCIADFDRIIRKYPGTPYAGNALFSKAEAYSGMYKVSHAGSDLDAAVSTYEEFLEKYPKNRNARQAKAKLKAMNYSEQQEMPSAPVAKQSPSAPKTYADASSVQPREGVVRINEIRHWSNTGYTRVVIDLEGAVTYKARKLKRPERLFFDLKRATLGGLLKGGTIVINDGILKTVRASQYDSETVRVVMDLESIASYRTLMLSDPTRLVVDVTGRQIPVRRGKGRIITLRRPANRPFMEAPQEEPLVKVEPEPEKAVPEEKPAPVQERTQYLGSVVIDPGHGGHDTGAVGPDGLQEKDVVLDIALRLREILLGDLGCKVVMTRDKDVFIDLDARPGVAVQQDADLFISIHANASRDKRAKGIETYLLNLTKDRNIMEVAARENMTTLKSMGDLDVILKDLILDSKRDESLHLAHSVQAKLVGDLRDCNPVNDKGVKQGPFLVLYGASMPSILTEVGFISNPDEEALLATPEYREKVAEAIYDGIKDYISNAKVVAASSAQ